MKIKRPHDLVSEFDAEFNAAWEDYRATVMTFKPRSQWVERVAVVSINGEIAVIKRMGEDGEIYTAEVPISDLDEIRGNR